MFDLNILKPTAVLVSTIIGIGMFVIPFTVMKSSYPVGLLLLIVVALIVLLTKLYLCEIILSTENKNHLIGYANKYLGFTGKNLMLVALIFGIYSSIITYMIGLGTSFSYIFTKTLNYELIFSILSWIFISFLSFFRMKILDISETIGFSVIVLILILLIFVYTNKISLKNLNFLYRKNTLNYLLPFGVMLFAFMGYTIIPEITDIMKDNKKDIKKIITLSVLICFILFATVMTLVIGLKGTDTPHLATLALGSGFIVLGIITMLTSYLGLSIAVINSFIIDLKMNEKKAWLLCIFIPLIIYLFLYYTKNNMFTKLAGIGGAISAGLIIYLIFQMIEQTKKKTEREPEFKVYYTKWIKYVIITIFVGAIVFELYTTKNLKYYLKNY